MDLRAETWAEKDLTGSEESVCLIKSRQVERETRSRWEIQALSSHSLSPLVLGSLVSQQHLGNEENPACLLPHRPPRSWCTTGHAYFSLFSLCAQRRADIGKSVQRSLNDVWNEKSLPCALGAFPVVMGCLLGWLLFDSAQRRQLETQQRWGVEIRKKKQS